jgi:hypothetical protein
MPFLHTVDLPAPQRVTACKVAPTCSRNHVYVFMIHGLDPFDWANLQGVRDYIQALGFRKTYYGQLYHTSHFEKEVRRLHQEDPEARFVLIGFSFGANMVRALANQAQAEGIPIDLLVYLGGNTLKNEPRDQPENTAKIVNILASGCIWNGAWMDRAENIHEQDVFHFGSPSHPVTLEVLARELAVIAGQVPAVSEAGPELPAEVAPIPAPTQGEWDFLKPVARLGDPPAVTRPAGPPR